MEQLEREDRLARMRPIDHNNERPLRQSRSREHVSPKFGAPEVNTKVYERVFQTEEEKEAALRRRRLIEDTDPKTRKEQAREVEKDN